MAKQASLAQGKAALSKLEKQAGSALARDTRSAVTRLMMPVLMDNTSQTALGRVLRELRTNFVDWNEVRISEARELIAVFSRAGVKHANSMTRQLQLCLKDVFEQHNIVNFEFERLDETKCVKVEVVEQPENPETPVPREEGLPSHATISGFVDGERLLNETTSLPLKIVQAKNSDRIFNVVWENPARLHARAVWAVGLSLNLVAEGLSPVEALNDLRACLGKSEEQERFAALAIARYEKSPGSFAKYFEKMGEAPPADEDKTAFAVTLGLMPENNGKKGPKEPVMPRAERMGRVSKRAKPKLAAEPIQSRGSTRTKKVTKKQTTRVTRKA
ncbi:MAG: hypothetical protein HUU29_07650 [Planctomycetaceae bacterium]|nr:hypothetical protein [Planctomycetaceae bacterium]